MTSFPFPDLMLSRVLEGAEAAACRAFCNAAASLNPAAACRVIPCAGGVGLMYGPSDPLNSVKGVGLNGPVDPRELDDLEAAFKPSPVVVDLSPVADEAFVNMLMERGYRIAGFETVTCRPIKATSSEPPRIDPSRSFHIDTLDPADAVAVAHWTRVLELGFADGGEPMKFSVDLGAVRAKLASTNTEASYTQMFLASVNGEPAGGAAMSIVQVGAVRVAMFSGAAVLPAFRRRGIQSAFTQMRLDASHRQNCDLAKIDVRAGTASHRNAFRAGFQVAYTRPQLVRTW